MKVIWATAIVLAVMAIPQLTGLGSALSKSGNSILGDAHVGPGKDSIAVPAAFRVVDYVFESATRESMLETNSHHWTLANQDGQEFHVVFHQPYSGWHDFDREIRSRDWKPLSSQQSREFSVGETTLTVISMNYRNNLAEYRTAFNTQFDGFGEGFEVPLMWRNPVAFFGRASARIGNRTRPRLVTGLSMELNVYLDTIGSNPEADVQQTEALFESVVTQILTSIQNGSFSSAAGDSEPK